jgi:hypothetical protein
VKPRACSNKQPANKPKTQRGAAGKLGLDLMSEVGFIEVGGDFLTGIQTQGAGSNTLNGRSLQCEYTSLSGRIYWTVVDFDHANNNLLIDTRFYNADALEEGTGNA